MEGGSRSVVVAALVANLGITVAKFVGFLVTGAASMLAESVHSLADSGNQALLLLGGSRARRRATPQHPFGYGRERYFWAFVVALILFSLGGLFAIYEGIEKLRHPHELESATIAVAILVVAVVLESYALRKAVRQADAERGGQSWWRFLRRSKTPEIPVVLLEDAGAEIGLLVALAGVAVAQLTGDARWDAAGSLAIGLLLVVIAVFLAIEMKSLLIGESASASDETAIRSAVEQSPHVRRFIHLRTQHLGPDELLVGAKVELDGDLTFAEVTATINTIERRLREAMPEARVVYIEPDLASADKETAPA